MFFLPGPTANGKHQLVNTARRVFEAEAASCIVSRKTRDDKGWAGRGGAGLRNFNRQECNKPAVTFDPDRAEVIGGALRRATLPRADVTRLA